MRSKEKGEERVDCSSQFCYSVKRKENNMSKVIDRLTHHVADMNVLYVKLHNFHWNLEGADFLTVHAKIEEYYNELHDQMDALAERAVQLGGKAPGCMKEYLSLACLKEEATKAFKSRDVFASMKGDYEALVREFKETLKEADSEGDIATSDLMGELIDSFEKTIWMVGASLK